MTYLEKQTAAGVIQGEYEEAFAGVVAAFERNFAEHAEVGASLCVMHEGRSVVDVWGGMRSAETGTPWTKDTISVIFSSTKGAVALAGHTLISEGKLDLDAPVKNYWPEFASNGKEEATVRMMFDHSVGVPCFRETLRDGGCCDWDYMVEQLAAEAPFWEPGTRNGYHMMNFGWTVGELIRRVSGESLGEYFQRAIAAPADAQCWIGLPEEQAANVAPIISARPQRGAPVSRFTKALLNEPHSISAKALFNQGGFKPNSPTCHRAEIGGGGGLSNGRGLARIYAPFACGGELAGHTYVDAVTLARMQEVACATHEDATLLIPTRFGLGFMKSIDNRRSLAVAKDSAILGATAFGHVGAGGSVGFADPAHKLSFGYTMNKLGLGLLLNERGQSLVDATYQSLGCTSNAAGVWS